MFRKRKTKSVGTGIVEQLTDKAAGKIVAAILYTQNRFATFMNRKTSHFSARTWKILTLVSGTCWGLFSLYVFSTLLFPFPGKPTRAVRKSIPSHMIGMRKHNDSLEWMEKIYDTRKKLMQQIFDTTNIK